MKGYYDTIPPSLEESARIDGCTRFQAFYKIILPLSSVYFYFKETLPRCCCERTRTMEDVVECISNDFIIESNDNVSPDVEITEEEPVVRIIQNNNSPIRVIITCLCWFCNTCNVKYT